MRRQLRPRVPLRFAVVTGAARHEAAHAVAEDRQFLDRTRPGGDELLQRFRELRTVVGDMQAAVVAQVERRAAERTGQCCAVIVSLPPPLQVVQAQAVHEDQQAAGGRGSSRRAQRARRIGQVDRLAAIAHGHRDRQRVGGPGEVVAVHTVDGGQQCIPARPGRAFRHQLDHRRERRVDAAPDEVHAAANGAVDEAGDAPRGARGRLPEWPGPPLDRVMHPLDHIDEPGGRLERQARHPVQVGGVRPVQFRHDGSFLMQSGP